MCKCVCVCEREREREREQLTSIVSAPVPRCAAARSDL